jgi:hypothetical protein
MRLVAANGAQPNGLDCVTSGSANLFDFGHACPESDTLQANLASHEPRGSSSKIDLPAKRNGSNSLKE